MTLEAKIRRLLSEMEITLHPDSFTIVSINKSEEDKAKGIIADLGPFSSLTFDLAEVSLVVKTEK